MRFLHNTIRLFDVTNHPIVTSRRGNAKFGLTDVLTDEPNTDEKFAASLEHNASELIIKTFDFSYSGILNIILHTHLESYLLCTDNPAKPWLVPFVCKPMHYLNHPIYVWNENNNRLIHVDVC